MVVAGGRVVNDGKVVEDSGREEVVVTEPEPVQADTPSTSHTSAVFTPSTLPNSRASALRPGVVC